MDAVRFQGIGAAEVAYRKLGKGEPLVCLHGWPLSGLTYRKLMPLLSQHFTCYLVDLLGAGETRWTETTDFSFASQAESVKTFIDKLGLKSYALLAHDTGATI